MRGILWASLVIATGFYIAGPLVDPDLWWHIAVGRWINFNFAIPTSDYWNMFGVGKPWRAYSWSFESLVAFIDGTFGIYGLLVAQWSLAVAVATSFMWIIGSLARDHLFGALVGAFATLACFNHYTLRPQSVTWILFASAILFAERYREKGIAKFSLPLAIIGCLWGNLHLASMLGLFAVVTWLFGRMSLRALSFAGGSFVLGTLVTPYFGGEWVTLVQKAGHPFSYSTIAEFQPATVMQYTTAFVLMLAVSAVLVVRDAGARISQGIVAGGVIYLLAGLAVVKFLPYAIIYIAAIFAIAWREAATAGPKENFVGALRALFEIITKIPKEGLAFVLLCTAVVNVMGVWPNPVARGYLPEEALLFVEETKLPPPYLTTFGDGGYLMYRLTDLHGTPRALVPIDGRTNVSPPEVIHAQQETLRGGEGWRSFIDLVQPRTIVWRRESPLTSILREGREWCEVYRDGSPKKGYTVYIRRGELSDFPNVAEKCNAIGDRE